MMVRIKYGYPTKLTIGVLYWVEPLVLASGEMVAVGYLYRLSPKLKHWVTICAKPMALARCERVP